MSLDYDNITVKVGGEEIKAESKPDAWKMSSSKAPVFAVGAVSWEGISGKPTAYPPTVHDHDSRYYTRPEIVEQMAGKSDIDHVHDDRYYQKEPIDTMLAGKSNVGHDHDGRYYTETEADALLAGKQDVLTFDQVPTAESTNPVMSGGVYGAIQDAGSTTAEASGSLLTLTDAADAPVAGLTVDIQPLQAGSGDPSPDNVRAITGWDACNVASTGKNLCAQVVYVTDSYHINAPSAGDVVARVSNGISYSFTSSGRGVSILLGYFRAGQVVTVSFTNDGSGLYRIVRTSSLPSGNGYVDSSLVANVTDYSAQISYTLNVESDGYYWAATYKTGQTSPVTFTNIQLELGSSATTYEPYNGQTVTIDLGGTRYGGRLDVPTGVLTVNRAMVDLGTLTWNYTSQQGFMQSSGASGIKKPSVSTDIIDILCSTLRTLSANAIYLGGEGVGIHVNGQVRIKYSGMSSDPTTFKSDVTGWMLCYPLETPLTVQLTPAEVRTLSGLNNLWADTGNVTLTYYTEAGAGVAEAVSNASANAKYDDEQTRKMITNNIETTTTASKSYSAGNLIILNGQLLRATTGIGIGGTITIGSNAEVITLETLLSELSA